MSWEIILHPEVEDWYLKLEDPVTAELVTQAVDMLASGGPSLRRPLVGEIVASRHKNRTAAWIDRWQ